MERAFGGHLVLAESWECPQRALIGRLVLMKFLKCIYLHLHNSPTLPHCREQLSALLARLCIHSHLWKIPYGRFPVGKSVLASKEPCQVWQCELCAFTLTKQHKSLQWLSSQALISSWIKCLKQMLLVMQRIGKRQGWIPDPGTSRSRYSNNSGITVFCSNLRWFYRDLSALLSL